MKTTNNLNNKQFKNQFNLLKQIVMKKQLLLLIVAFFAVTTAFGQALPGSAPRGINCTDDALHPIAGKEYTYQASSNQTGSEFTFWATTDPNFITTTSGTTTTNIASRLLTTPVAPATTADLIAVSSNYATKTATDNVKITWSDAILNAAATKPTFVAVNTDGTCANNFDAWELVPLKAFTVDIRNVENSANTPLAFDAPDNQCIDQVRGAVYNAGTIQYNFGTNVLYYEVIAANFTTSWTPTFNISGLGNGQTALLEWSYTNTFASIVGTGTITNTAALTTVKADVDPSVTNTTTGVSIYVRVTVSNNTYEGINPTSITLTVDGVNSVGDWDIENNTLTAAGPACNPGALNDKMDAATQVLDPRPTVTPVVPTPFVTGNETN